MNLVYLLTCKKILISNHNNNHQTTLQYKFCYESSYKPLNNSIHKPHCYQRMGLWSDNKPTIMSIINTIGYIVYIVVIILLAKGLFDQWHRETHQWVTVLITAICAGIISLLVVNILISILQAARTMIVKNIDI